MMSNKKGIQSLNSKCMKTIQGGFIIITDDIGGSCFEETTMITTQNGQKMIKDLDMAMDQVWNPMNQKWMKISRKTVSLVKGMAYDIFTEAGQVTVTSNHPFMTIEGEVVQACELTEADSLANGDRITKIAAMVIEDYMIVHNLVFTDAGEANEDHFVEANGVVSGVLPLQDKINHRSPLSRAEKVLN